MGFVCDSLGASARLFVSDNVKKTKKVRILVCVIYHPLVEGLILCLTVGSNRGGNGEGDKNKDEVYDDGNVGDDGNDINNNIDCVYCLICLL